ncbi:hypothetical protein Q6316_29815, partial [Klebsiella pneumoniae]|uniref:hypothetical protein n=1 Tax=Klebsiella pneumoniae TaxID=573 RepID=UPI002731CED2
YSCIFIANTSALSFAPVHQNKGWFPAIPIPDYQTLMLPVLKSAALGETSVPKTESFIAAELGLAQEDIDKLLPSGRQR